MDQIKSLSKKEVAGGISLLFLLYSFYKYRKLVKWQQELSTIAPGPKCHPLMGNLPEMMKADGFSEQLFKNLHAEHGDVVRFFLGPTMCNMSINNPDMIHELYKKARERPHETYMFLWYLGKGNLLFQRGKLVKDMRLRYGTMITQRSQLEKVHAVSTGLFKSETEDWIKASSSGQSVDLFSKLGPAIYDIMGQVMFDAPWLSTETGREVYRLHKKLIVEVNRWVLWPVGPIFHPAFIDYLLTIRKWRNMVGALIEERGKDMRLNPKKYENDTSAIHMILTSKADDGTPFFSRERAISTMCGFLNGAYDTTHATTYWIFFFLAKHPETQAKLVDEFARVVGNVENPSLDDLRKCDYLHAFLQEVMRMRSTVPVNQRVSDEEDINIGGYIIPKGTNVNIPNCVMFMDERWFGKNPEQFRPERFLGPSAEAERARKSWTPFGEHTRMCVGQIFALVEMKAVIYMAVSRTIIDMEDPNDPGLVMIEAGVNQPVSKAKFIFRRREMGKLREEENLKWWMTQIDALEKVKPAAGSVAHVA